MKVKHGLGRAAFAAAAAGLLFSPALAQDPATDAPKVALELVADELISPLTLHSPPDDDRLFVIEQTGEIRIIEDGEVLEEDFLDLSDRMIELDEDYDERGLLGLAFHPDYADNGRFFVYYSAPLRDDGPEDWNATSHISEFTVSED
ncbi:MAG TPA: PQQ-dependent sugar dehydrogenase, partial [Deinococcales bacterium]|nr:PQQ-dependent sugar dehydrogenase [Deinococcales bacterium]